MKTKCVKRIVFCITIICIMLFSSVGSASALSSEYMKSPYYTKLAAVLNSKTGNQRMDIVNIALSQVGYMEGSVTGTIAGNNNVTEYGNWARVPGKGWCAAFVSWCANLAGVSTSEISGAYPPSLCPKWTNYTSSSKLQPGDILNINNGDHSAIVWKVEGGKIRTIEGNMGYQKPGETKVDQVTTVVQYDVSTGKTSYYDAKITSFYSPNYKTTTPAPTLDNKINLTSSFPSVGITKGTSFKFKGTVTSNYKVGSVTATITGNGVSQVFDSGSTSVASYDLANLNKSLKTEKLAPGTYTLTIKMRNIGTSTVASKLLTKKWTFKVIPALDNRINLTSTFPSTGITEGKSFKFAGTVTSNYNVRTVTATIKGNGISQVFDVGSLNVSSYDLSNLNQKLKTEKLTPGAYTLTIKMMNVGTSAVASTLLTKTFNFKVQHDECDIPAIAATCTASGKTAGKQCSACNKITMVPTSIPAKGHNWETSYTVDKKATTSAAGSKSKHCTRSGCSAKSSVKSIAKISTISLSGTKLIYNGEKRAPYPIIKDTSGEKLVKGTDYTVTYGSSKRTSVGRYSVKVTFKGNYSGTKTLYFNILPKAPSTMTTKLYGHDDVKISWSKSTGADGYYVYYKKSTSSSYIQLTRTTSTSAKISGLTDGAYYYFKVVPYFKSGDTRYESTKYKTSGIYTLKKMEKPTAARSGTKVKIGWKKIDGATGYHVRQYQKKNGEYVKLSGYYTKDASKLLTAAKGKTRYYRVRAYKTVDGVKIFGPWSDMKSYTR